MTTTGSWLNTRWRGTAAAHAQITPWIAANWEELLGSAVIVRLLRRNGSQRGLGRPAAAMAGSRLDETVGDSGGRLHVSRSGSKRTTGARAVTIVSYGNVKQLALASVCDGDGAAFRERERNRKTLRLSGGAKSTYFDKPARQRPQVPIQSTARAGFARFGYHRFCGSSSGGRELWRQATAVARWAPTCAGAHQNCAASLP